MDEKTCNACGRSKPLTEYHKNNQQSDGLAGTCKPCRNSKRRAYYNNNVHRARKYAKKSQAGSVLPRRGQMFRAYIHGSGREHVASPFKCQEITQPPYAPPVVVAGDWRLSAGDFYFTATD